MIKRNKSFILFKNIVGIYKIINNINGKSYIGSSRNICNRLRCHYYELRNNKHCNKRLQNSWNKYGEENFEFQLVETCNLENLI